MPHTLQAPKRCLAARSHSLESRRKLKPKCYGPSDSAYCFPLIAISAQNNLLNKLGSLNQPIFGRREYER